MLMIDSGFVILDMQHKTEGDVVDVFIGEDRTRFRLPVKLAHGLTALLRQILIPFCLVFGIVSFLT